MNELNHLARVSDRELAGRASGAGARALLEAIVTDEITAGDPVPRPRAPRRTRRLVVGFVATAALVAAAVVGPSLLTNGEGTATSYANSAIDVELRGDTWVARVKDPYADHALYAEAFKAVGLDVGLNLVPVSPPRVGQVVRMAFEGTVGNGKGVGGTTEPEGCTLGQVGCSLAVTVDRGFIGKGVISLGRAAKPGEKYQDAGPASRKGGMLAGYRADERTVGEVLAEVRRRGLKAVFQIIDPSPDGHGYGVDPKRQSAHVGDDWIVWEAESEEAGVVRLLVTKERLPKNPVYGGHKPDDAD
ncbi:hypothetical protein ABZ297_34540 [Nonomuraea sp. NPDC005983]|uniref:hypothetical protein n=1 Tax=Nonomuraea sp. NPDC005983 TaxID=3155595 RepID=UPI0033AA2C98